MSWGWKHLHVLTDYQSQPPICVTFYVSYFWTITKPLLSGGKKITVNNPLEFLFSIWTTNVRENWRQPPLYRARGNFFFYCVWCLCTFRIQLFSAWQIRAPRNAGSSAEGKRIVRKGYSLWLEFNAEYRSPTLVPFFAESIICLPTAPNLHSRGYFLKVYKSIVTMHVRGFVLLELPRALLTASSTSPQTFSQGCFFPL